MALSRSRVNPYNVLKLRKLTHIPSHFAKISISGIENINLIDTWIYHNLDSRYCIKFSYIVDDNKKLKEVCEIGVEDAKELTMLSLGCPYLK
jgi:hypothetical protein